ncbi:MAG: MFS transporter [Promethearchaeota archaeon]
MLNKESNPKWKFWPVLCLAFIFAFSNPLVSIATPLFYANQVPIRFLSLMTSALTITYSISPLVLNKISDRIGRRKSIIISMAGATLAQLMFFITLNPILFLIERLLEGFILGFFFPNLQATISDDPTLDQKKHLARFNLSWSLAIVLGLLFGTFFVEIVELKYIFYISPVFLVVNTIIALLFFQEPINNQLTLEERYPDTSMNLSPTTVKYYIPVIIPLLLILASSFASGNGMLLYPIRAKGLGFSDSSTYLVNVFATFSQTITMYLATSLVLKKLRTFSVITVFIYSFLFIFFTLNKIYYLFILLFIFSGFFYGFLYGAASKFFLTLNVLKKTSKYTSISESSLGITYFISQLFLGFMADISVFIAYYSLSLSLVIIFLVALIFIRKFKEL